MIDSRTEQVYGKGAGTRPVQLLMRFPSLVDYETLVDTAARILLHGLPGGSELFERVEQPLVQATAHAVRDVNGERAELPVEVEIEVDAARLKVSITDRGAPFKLPRAPRHMVETADETRRRLDVVAAMTDHVEVENLTQGNRLSMTWKVSREPSCSQP